MDIDLLRTFLEVHRTRHFARAADNLFITSAAVSARIKHLEQQLGVTLFVRDRRNVQLTNEGERLLPHAESLVTSWARTVRELAMESTKRSRLHIGATYGLWQFSLNDKIANLRTKFPDLALQAEGHTDTELVRKLEDRTLDIVVLYDPPATPEFRSVKVGQLKLVMAATEPDLTTRKAFELGYIYVDWGTSFSGFHAKRFSETPPAALHVNLASIALHYLDSNPGAAWVPESVLAERGLHRVKQTPSFNRSIHATWREGSDRPELLKQIVEQLEGLSI